ncbi:MAG: hypothetical protein V4635_00080 [Bacteroidota bacterium]
MSKKKDNQKTVLDLMRTEAEKILAGTKEKNEIEAEDFEYFKFVPLLPGTVE